MEILPLAKRTHDGTERDSFVAENRVNIANKGGIMCKVCQEKLTPGKDDGPWRQRRGRARQTPFKKKGQRRTKWQGLIWGQVVMRLKEINVVYSKAKHN